MKSDFGIGANLLGNDNRTTIFPNAFTKNAF